MECPNCKSINEEGASICSICNASLIKQEINNESNEKKKSPVGIILIIFGVLSILSIGLFVFILTYYPFKWNESYMKNNTKIVTPSIVKLAIVENKKINPEEVKFESKCGTLKNNGLEVTWNLTKAEGKCELIASYKNKKLKKTLNVFTLNKELAYMDDDFTGEPDEDYDKDGLTNKEEEDYKTNPKLLDSDMDGLDDHYEIFDSKTDPNKKDTDKDGLNDYDEIELGLDPNKEDSKGDGIKDGDRTLTYKYENDNVKIELTGKGNIASVTANVNVGTKISKKTGLIDKLYSFYTDGKMDEATVTIPYTAEDITNYSLDEDSLSLYYYNTKTMKYEKIETVVDKENKTITAKLKHFSDYVVGDKSVDENSATYVGKQTNILFILDNSWSLYSKEQYEKFTGEKFPENEEYTGYENDVDGIRFTVTKDLVEKFSTKGYQLGLSEFRYDYTVAYKLGSDKKDIKTKLDNMMGVFITKKAGTNISNALDKGMSEFNKKTDNNFIVILTDGQDSSLSYRKASIIKSARDKNIKICSLGLGKGAESEHLSDISNATGCKYLTSSNADGLNEIFDNLETEINDDLVDLDGDNVFDGVLVADSGFIINRDGFNFPNYSTNKISGHCFGMATFAELYYKKVLPTKSDAKTIKEKYTSYPYELSDYFKKGKNLYDYEIKNETLKAFLDEEYESNNKNIGLNKLVVVGTRLEFIKEIKDIVNKTDYLDIEIRDIKISKERAIELAGAYFNQYEKILLNEDKLQKSDVDKDDINLINALYVAYLKQHTNEFYVSGSNLDIIGRDIFDVENIVNTDGNVFMEILKTRIKNGDPVTISGDFDGGQHGINAINLIQDIKNPNLYYVGVYDNNYPDEKKYVNILCNKKECFTQKNNYYSKDGSPIRITASLESDVKYFQN